MKTTNKILTLKAIVLSYLFLSIDYTVSAQPIIEWEKNYGGTEHDFAYSIQKTINGGYIIAGSSRSDDGDVGGNYGSEDYWIVKLDDLGDLEWEKNYGGTEADRALSIQQTTDQGYIVIGWSESNDGDVGGNYGGWDYWIIKLDVQGNLEWQKNYGGSADEYAYTIQQTSDGGYIGVGFTYSNSWDVGGNYGGSDYWVIKLDNIGNLEWEKNYGGTDGDRAYSVQQTINGGYIIAGHSSSINGDVDENNGYSDYWIVKLDELGNIEWKNNYGGSSGEEAYSVQQTTDGGYIVAGKSSSNDGDVGGNYGGLDNWIIKLDELGNLEWENNFGGMWQETSNSVQQTIDGGYIIAGHSHILESFIDSWIIKLDLQGNLEWKENYGGVQWDEAESILQTVGGDYIVAGYSKSRDGDVSENNGESDFWIIKLLNNQCGCTEPSACNYNPDATCEDSSCLQNCNETDVYPGDLNHDGIVNHVDHGLIGLYKTEIGPPRATEHLNTDWYPHPAQDWGTQQLNNEDIKHFDCNGDGYIDQGDWEAVTLNMDSTWTTPMPPPAPPIESDYQVMFYPRDQISEDLMVFNIALERRTGGELTTQGGYFTIDYSFIEESIDYVTLGLSEQSWLGNRGENLEYDVNEFFNDKKIEIGFTKTDRLNSTGSGVIGDLIVSLNTTARLAKSSNNLFEFQIINNGVHNGNSLTPIEDQVVQIDISANDCEPNWTITEDTPVRNMYKSDGTIETDGFVLIGSDQQVTYQANHIQLNSGFSVKVDDLSGSNTQFTATIGACN